MAKEINLFEQDFFQASEVFTKLKDEQDQQELYTQSRIKAKRIIEALLFASNEPLTLQKIREIIDPIYPFKPKVLTDIINELQIEYHAQQRAFQLEEIGQGYLLRTCKDYSPYIDQLYRNKRGEKLSQPATEVLAIIAYRQPITRPHIESIRGVDSSGIIQSLLERELIEPVGKLEAPGRPTLFATTKQFLTHFGLRDLSELPKLGMELK